MTSPLSRKGGGALRSIGLIALLALCTQAAFSDTVSTPLMQYGYGSITSNVAYSPDGTKFLTGDGDGDVRLWSISTGAVVRTFNGHTGSVRSVAFSPDGTKVLTGAMSPDNTAMLWNSETGTVLHSFTGHADSVNSVAVSPDGTQVLTGSDDHTAKLWNASTGALIRTFAGHTNGVLSVAFSPDGTKALTGSDDYTAKLWNAATGAEIRAFTGHAGSVLSVAFSPDGTKVLTGSSDSKAKVWNVATGTVIFTSGAHTDDVHSVAFSPDGTQALTGSYDGTSTLLDASTGSVVRTFTAQTGYVYAVAFSPDGTKVLTCSSWNVKLWTTGTGVLITTFIGHTAGASSVAFSPDGTKVLAGTGYSAMLWDWASGVVLRSFDGHTGYVNSVAFSPDGTQVLTGSSDHTAKLWNASTGELIRTFTGHKDVVRSVAFSSDGIHALTGSNDDTTILWICATGHATTYQHEAAVVAVAFSPKYFDYVACSFQKAQLWAWSSGGDITLTYTGWASAAAFSSSGNFVLIARGNGVDSYSTATGALSTPLTGGHTDLVTSVASAPNGTNLLTGSKDKTAKLWVGGKVQRTFQHTYSVSSVAFSPDGTKVLTSGGGINLWLATGTSSDVSVPDVAGKTEAAARTALTSAGLTTGKVTQQSSTTVAAGLVISQSPAGLTDVPFGSAVNLVMSTGLTPAITGSVVINNNRSATNSTQATLALTWGGGGGTGVVRMRFSNDGATWSAWEPLQSTYAYTLPSGDGHKTVRVQYLDQVNYRSPVFSDYIRLDTTPPTGSIIINAGASTTTTPSVTLGLTWADAGASVSRMRFSDDGAHWTAWTPPTATCAHALLAGLGYRTVRVQYLDGANNYSAVFSDYIKVVTP